MKEQQIRAYDSITGAEAAIRGVLTVPENPTPTDAVVKNVAGDMIRGNKFAKSAWPQYGSAEDIRALFCLAEIPVLVVAGKGDIVEPPAKMKPEIQDGLNSRRDGQAKLVVIEDSGHLLPIEKPYKVASTISDFIEGL
ncbi:hypothetical protein GGI43DRAFT_427611 [Trichoderma evansii]